MKRIKWRLLLSCDCKNIMCILYFILVSDTLYHDVFLNCDKTLPKRTKKLIRWKIKRIKHFTNCAYFYERILCFTTFDTKILKEWTFTMILMLNCDHVPFIPFWTPWIGFHFPFRVKDISLRYSYHYLVFHGSLFFAMFN